MDSFETDFGGDINIFLVANWISGLTEEGIKDNFQFGATEQPGAWWCQ